jgi:hypothetical protein
MGHRKTRIKVVNMINGDKVYIPQHQSFFGSWYDFGDHDGYSITSHTNPYTYGSGYGSSLHSAQKQIDNYIAAYNKEEIRRKGKDIVNVEYIKYP